MATFDKVLLSGSTGGRPIKVAATATPGTTVHDTGISATILDEIWLWLTNTDTVARKCTVEFGGVTSPDDTIEVTIPAESGPFLVIPGFVLAGTGAAARSMKVFAATANVVLASGYVNRITP